MDFCSGPGSVMAPLPSPHGVTLVLGATWQFLLVLKVSQHCVHVFLVSHPCVLVLRMPWMCLLFPEGDMALCTGAEDVMGVLFLRVSWQHVVVLKLHVTVSSGPHGVTYLCFGPEDAMDVCPFPEGVMALCPGAEDVMAMYLVS